jgi:hypothetical protein
LGLKWGFAVLVTDSSNNILYPKPGQTSGVTTTVNWNTYGLYSLAGKNPETDAEMTLENPIVAVTQGQKLRIYESEVWKKNGADGLGDVCFDVTLLYA